MNIQIRSVGTAAAVVFVSLAAVPALASTKSTHKTPKPTTHKVKFIETGGKLVDAKTVKGKIVGSFGPGTYAQNITSFSPPADNLVLTLKGGTIKMSETGTLTGTTVTSKWKITGGTGKYKHITGSGAATGDVTTSTYTYTGKAKY